MKRETSKKRALLIRYEFDGDTKAVFASSGSLVWWSKGSNGVVSILARAFWAEGRKFSNHVVPSRRTVSEDFWTGRLNDSFVRVWMEH